MSARQHEPWLDKRGLAEHFACSVRSIELAMSQGMPHALIFGRPKARASEVEVWLAERGQLERRGDPPDRLLAPNIRSAA
ncbi:MAG TPA: hypothetical protein VGL78_15490 [Solirubrobacteraceae bacterium]